jgi:hypothetical protein
VFLFVFLFVCVSICPSICLSFSLSFSLRNCLLKVTRVSNLILLQREPDKKHVGLSLYLSVHKSCLCIHRSLCLFLCPLVRLSGPKVTRVSGLIPLQREPDRKQVCLSLRLSVCLSVCLSVFFLSNRLSICLSICLPICLSICLSLSLCACLPVYLFICLVCL